MSNVVAMAPNVVPSAAGAAPGARTLSARGAISAEVAVGNVGSQGFYAAIDTIIYGRQYVQGQAVDTSSWNRRQVLQYLSLGLIIGPPVSSEGTPGYLIPCIVLSSDETNEVALVLMPSGQLLRDVKVLGTPPADNSDATLVTTTDARWVIGAGIPSDLVVDSLTTASLSVTGDSTFAGTTSISQGAEPGWIATSGDELGTVTWSPPSDLSGVGAAIISDGVAPPTDDLPIGSIWYNPSEDSAGPSFWTFQNLAARSSKGTVNNTYLSLQEWGGYTTTVPGPGLVVCDWSASMQAATATGVIRVGLWAGPDNYNAGTYVYACAALGASSMCSGQSYCRVTGGTDIDWDWRGFSTVGSALTIGVATIRFSFFPNATMAYTNY